MAGLPIRTGSARQPVTLVSQLLLTLLLLVPVVHAQAAEATVRADSPESYTVVEGDTLWDISARFLEEPWLWPEVWQINPQIANPDLIYPGDVIELTYVNGSPVLRLAGSSTPGLRTVRLSPQARREPLLSPIPAISLEQISAHLSGNLVVSAAEYDNAPYILGETEGHELATAGDEIYARGSWAPGVVNYDIVRSGPELTDPDTRQAIGIEAIQIGTASISRANSDQAILMVDSVLQEVRVGDRLIPAQRSELQTSYLPRPPAAAINAAIVSIGSGKVFGGLHDTLVLNVGAKDGIETGHLLTLREPDAVIEDELGAPGAWMRFKQVVGLDESHKAVFPGDNYGSVLIYRVFDNASLGLVLASKQAIRVNDRIVTP